MPKLFIDDKEVEFQEGEDILTVALRDGLEIPHFCYHEGLSRVATCRMCLVDVVDAGNGKPIPKLQTSCSTKANDNMKVSFDNHQVKEAQAAMMEFLLLNHPLDCAVCDQAGECILQDYSYNFGSGQSAFEQEKRVYGVRAIGSFLNLERNRCIHCTRCVRFSQEISQTHEMGTFGRSHNLTVDTFIDQPLTDNFQGNLADICPVGAITVSDFRFRQKVWKLEATESICTACSRGCNIHIHHKNNKVYRFTPRKNEHVNQWWMCDQGRVSFHDVLETKKALSNSQITGKNAPLDEALLKASQLLRTLKKEDKVLILASKFSSLEEIISLQLFSQELIQGDVLFVAPDVPEEKEKSTIPIENLVRMDKSPNANGLKKLSVEFISLKNFTKDLVDNQFALAIVVNNYDEELILSEKIEAFTNIIYLSPFENQLTQQATVSFAVKNVIEKDGFFINCDGYIQQTQSALKTRTKEVFDQHTVFSKIAKHYFNIHSFPSDRSELIEELENKLAVKLSNDEKTTALA